MQDGCRGLRQQYVICERQRSCKNRIERAVWVFEYAGVALPLVHTATVILFAVRPERAILRSRVSPRSRTTVTSAVLALLMAATSAVFTFLNPKERAAGHLRDETYKSLHNDTRIFREIEMPAGPYARGPGCTHRKAQRHVIRLMPDHPRYHAGPSRKALKSIERGEAAYKADKRPRRQKSYWRRRALAKLS